MVRFDLSGFVELGKKYWERRRKLVEKSFPSFDLSVSIALKNALRRYLKMGTITQTEMNKYYAETGTGYYGKYASEDPSILNPQEILDPSTVRAVKAAQGIPHREKSFLNSSQVVKDYDGQKVLYNLTTEATMTPYRFNPKFAPRHIRQALARFKASEVLVPPLPERPIMYYLRRGWIDPNNPDHQMQPRPIEKRLNPIILEELKKNNYFNHTLLLSIGFKPYK